MNRITVAACAVLLLGCWPAGYAAVSVTVYNDNLGLVRQTRAIDVKKGVQRVAIDDVAARIDPTSVSMKTLGKGSVTVLEQNYEYDLVDTDKLLKKYIGRPVTIERRFGTGGDRKETLKGTLLSTAGGMVLETDGRIMLNPAGEVSLEKLPDGLVLKPTLSWLVDSAVAGPQEIELAYLTGGISWAANYVAVLSRDDAAIDLTGWVTLNNTSGVTYPDARLKLVAGDVNRVRAASPRALKGMAVADMAAAESFEEKSFFEYHLYTLTRPATINDNEIKQLELISAAGVPAKKKYVFDGARQNKVAVTMEFKNAKDRNLGIALPRGTIRVYKHDDDGTLAFVGEDAVDHTPKDETVRVAVGNAFDVVGERTVTDSRGGQNWREESCRIVLRNHKDAPVDVTAVEHLYGGRQWKVTQTSSSYVKKDAETIEYTVAVPRDGETTITYTVRYTW